MPDGRAWAPPGSGGPHGDPPGTYHHPAPPNGDGPAGDPPGGAERIELLGGDIPLRPLGVAEILDGAIVMIRHNPRGVLGLSLAVTTVVQVLQSLVTYFLIGDSARDEVTPVPIMRSLGTQLTVSLLGLLLSAYAVLLLAGMLGPVMGRTLLGLPTSPGQVWRDARPGLWRLVGVATLIMVISVSAAVLPVVPLIILAAGGTSQVAAGVIAAVVGIPLGLVSMVWLYVLLVLGTPAVIMERQRVTASLARARQLVRGRWWRVCGVLLLTLLITIFMGFFALRVPFVVAEFVFFGDELSRTEVFLQLALDTAGRIVSWTITIPFDAGVIALVYADRRMRREGFDLELRTGDGAAQRPAHFLDLWRPSTPAPPPPPGWPR